MKKFSILLAGLMAMAVVSCDEAPVEPPMPSNPQEPVMTDGNVVVQPAGVLASQDAIVLTPTSDGNLEVLDITSVENLPEGATVVANLEVATTRDFANATVLEGTVLDEALVVVSAADLLAFQTANYGQNPEAQTIYYRVPVYVTIGDVDFRLGGDDKYYAEGSFTTLYNPGYEIPERWFLVVGDVRTELTHSDASVYNDHLFFATVEVNTGDLWHLEAGGVTYGPADNLDDYDSGVLVVNQNNAKIAVGSKYAFAFELKVEEEVGVTSVEYSLTDASVNPGAPTGIYLRGGMNGWGSPAEYEFVETDQTGVYALLGVAITAGTEFKVADANWGAVNYGAAADNVLTPGVDVALGAGGENLTVAEDFYGNVFYTDINGMQTIRLFSLGNATAGEASGIYLRGGMNGWGAEAEWELTTTNVAGVYTSGVVEIPANVEFKVADANWSTINYGSSDVPFNHLNQYELEYNGGNLTMDVDFKGTVKLVVYGDKYYVRFFESN